LENCRRHISQQAKNKVAEEEGLPSLAAPTAASATKRTKGFGGASLLGGAQCLAGGLASSEFLDGGLVGGFLGNLASGSLNLFSGFAFDLVVVYSKSGVDVVKL